jgi:Bifunctional DNA primase/polymerase, N-terminal
MQYAVNGYRVLPVKPGSNAPPLISGYSKSATKDPERVAELWRRFPGANPGVATGGGLLIVDCDTTDAVSRAREWGVPEGTPTAKTPRGGKHFYLGGSGPSKVGFQPGVDLRGRGGYAVGAGARRSDGVYEWEVPPWEVDEAAIPAELERLIRETTKKDNRSAPGDRP